MRMMAYTRVLIFLFLTGVPESWARSVDDMSVSGQTHVKEESTKKALGDTGGFYAFALLGLLSFGTLVTTVFLGHHVSKGAAPAPTTIAPAMMAPAKHSLAATTNEDQLELILQFATKILNDADEFSRFGMQATIRPLFEWIDEEFDYYGYEDKKRSVPSQPGK